VASNIVVPQLGESVVEARVSRWLKKEGDAVTVGEPLVELETEKIDLEVGAEQAGVLAKIARREGEDVKIGDVLGIIGEAAAAPASPPAAAASASVSQATEQPAAASAPARAAAAGTDGRQLATPTARRMAETHDIALAGVPGTGEAGRITKRDVETFVTTASAPASPPSAAAPTSISGGQPAAAGSSALAGGSSSPTGAGASAPAGGVAYPASAAGTAGAGIAPPPQPVQAQTPKAVTPAPKPALVARPNVPAGERTEQRVRMSKRRLTIARNLVEAQHTAAMLTTFNEVDMTALMGLRERRKKSFQDRNGVGLGIASFFVKASVAALKAFPRLNAEIQGEEMVLKQYYDIGIAVGAEQGLVVPVLRNAEQMSFAGIELGIRDFATRARDGSLTLEDLRGGTFTITNGGVFGSLLSTPILNPPQVGILGLHKIEERPIASNGQVVIRPMMYVALSYDHRIVDGLEAVQFLVRIKEYIEDPGNLLLES
jgi:2-oxoglutarate dehydrogenase E2 component (dihydrolipoamide succinyltransferase)